ncbi:hypothetical protein D3C71_1106910 [compost metagenome]
MDGDGHGDLVDVGRHVGQVDGDFLVIAIAAARRVVARVDDGAVGRLQVVIENEISIGTGLAIRFQQEGAAVQVECGAIGGARVPAQANHDFLQARSFLAQVDIAAFLQTDRHGNSSLFNRVGC